MKQRLRFIFTIMLVAFVLLSCDLPFQIGEQATATMSPVQPTSASTLQVLPSGVPTLAPTAAPIKPVTTATATKPAAIDLGAATLKLTDLPAGFQELDAVSQAQIGLTPENLAKSFQNAFRQAAVVSMSAFLNPSPQTFEVVLSLVFYPLTQLEQASFDLELSDPAKAIAAFGQGFSGKAEPLAGADKYGNASIGMTFTTVSGALTLRGDMVIMRRESAAMLIMVMYSNGSKPPISAQTLCPVLDGRVKTAVGK